MRAMALVLGILCWSIKYVLAEFDESSSSVVIFPELIASSTTAHGKARPDDSDAASTKADESSSTDAHQASRSASASTTSHVPTRGASPNGGAHTHRPHLVTLSSTTATAHAPHPTTLPPEQAPHAQPPQRPPPSRHPHGHSNGGLIAGIVFGVLGGIAGTVLLLALARCLHSWRRTPARDRIRTTLDRHYLEQEMEQREREDLERRVMQNVSFRVRRPPPPPYQHAPAYDDAVGGCEGEGAAMMAPSPLPSATPSHAEFPPPDEPPPPAIEAEHANVEEQRRSGDGRHATGPDLV